MELPVRAASTSALLAALLGEDERVAIIDSPAVFIGIKDYGPGEAFANHYHNGYDEYFATLQGEVVVWMGRATKVVLAAGSSLLCPRGVQHYLVNETDSPAQLLYIKVPMIADDSHPVDWTPEVAS